MEQRPENVPPTPVPGLDLRMWFAGCALANSSVVTSSDPDAAVQQAIEVADRLMAALRVKLPSKRSMKPPTAKQMKKWETHVSNTTKATQPALKGRIQGRYAVTPDRQE